MENFNLYKIISGNTKLYTHCTLPGIYEFVPIKTPQVYVELSNCCYFIEYIELIDINGKSYMAILHTGCDLDILRSQNEYIEETYISLILRSVMDTIIYLHSLNFFNVNLELSNWRLLPCGSLKSKDRFSLTRFLEEREKDFCMFKFFTEILCEVGDLNDPEICVSALFKQFLAKTAVLDINNNNNKDIFFSVRENKFIKKHNNSSILADLIEKNTSPSEKSQILIRNKMEEPLKIAEPSLNHQTFIEEEFVTVSNKIFDKYIEEEQKGGSEKTSAVLKTIKKNLITLYKEDPSKALKFFKFYLK